MSYFTLIQFGKIGSGKSRLKANRHAGSTCDKHGPGHGRDPVLFQVKWEIANCRGVWELGQQCVLCSCCQRCLRSDTTFQDIELSLYDVSKN